MYKSGKTPIKLYQRLDDSLVAGANRAVKIWNWTTGRTKADLANLMIFTGAASYAYSIFLSGEGLCLIGGMAVAGYSAFMVPRNWTMEKKEAKASKSGALDKDAEHFKKTCKISGPIILVGGSTCSVMNAFPNHGVNTTAGRLVGLGDLIIGAQAYIMRADYLPPRKNAIARGLENVKEFLGRSVLEPVRVRAPVDFTSVKNLIRDSAVLE